VDCIHEELREWYLGQVDYQCNELEAAAQHFTQIVENALQLR